MLSRTAWVGSGQARERFELPAGNVLPSVWCFVGYWKIRGTDCGRQASGMNQCTQVSALKSGQAAVRWNPRILERIKEPVSTIRSTIWDSYQAINSSIAMPPN